ncbi:hypothetical protein ACFPKZ_04560 [Streptosporangium amethystogenes subsp. fukuiense]|uniref:hypothetical protein n=1 Tax=Streptosporangium amethystogenes TaxID=2002 RepID=UPI00361F527D
MNPLVSTDPRRPRTSRLSWMRVAMVAALVVLTGGTATPPAHAAAAPAFQTPSPAGWRST